MTTKLRQRTRFLFWLNTTESDRYIADLIEWLKSQKTYTLAIRQGLQLWHSLRSGDVSYLLELFPNIREQLAVTPAPPGSSGSGDLEQIKAMLETIAAAQTTGGYLMQSNPPAHGPKPLAAPKLALPVFEDDDDLPTVIIRKSENSDSSLNFVHMMQSLQ